MSKKKAVSSSALNYQDRSGVNIIVSAKSAEQKEVLRSIAKNTISFVRGPAGCGKTYLAVTYAIQQLLQGRCQKITLTRPVVEAAGEKLGFLPGDILDKLDPYIMPIYETLIETLPHQLLEKVMPKNGKDNVVRILPLAYMRGITFKNSYIICDEMQNATPDQIRMLLTRVGENSKMIICGDTRQTDIDGVNGLEDAFDLLKDIEDIGFVTMTDESIVRHPLIQKIEQKYEARATLKREQKAKRNANTNNV